MACKKCGSNDILGPRYRTDPWGGDFLQYRCFRCGFTWTGKTLDSASKQQDTTNG